MRVVTWIAAVLVALVGILAAVIATRPAEFTIERSVDVAAPPAVVFALVDDFHKWDGWSPWAKLDPAMKVTYSGPDSGVGAKYAWSGDRRVGEGRMAITDAKPGERVTVALDFIAPLPAQNVAEFRFAPAGGGTRVTWSMSGANGFVGKAFALLMNMDKLVGAQFEQGLASLKALAERQAQGAAAL
jgi:carbon monoxide dehydrogenase subunit G